MREKILVVSEDQGLQGSLGRALSQMGHAALAAQGPLEAEQILAAQRLSLLIIDNALSQCDPLQLLRNLRREYPWIEIIYLVLPENLESGAQALEHGASDFLLKPVSPRRLAIALKRAQERLIVRTKLAVLSGEALPELPGDQVDSVLAELDQGEACALVLYDTRQKYQQLFDEAPCYISVLDRDLRITAVNRLFKEDFGDMVGETCFDVFLGRSEMCPDCPVAETFGDGQSHRFEQVVTSRRGEQYNLLTWTAPIRDSQGEIKNVMEMSTNITEMRKLQDHLSSLGMLIGSISHGVKSLLTALDGGMYSLRSGFERNDPERIKKGWEVVDLMVGRIRRTVLDVLFYAKDRGLESETVDVADFARQVALYAAQVCKRHQIEFEAGVAEGLGNMEVDPNALNPAIINLLENAIDACLADQDKDRHKITFRPWREDDILVFDVEDNGMGMDETIKENLFTLFFTSKGSAGTGLGLFIANDTVEQHGGTITVDSEPGEGSHFHVRIPERPKAVLPTEKQETAEQQAAPAPLEAKAAGS